MELGHVTPEESLRSYSHAYILLLIEPFDLSGISKISSFYFGTDNNRLRNSNKFSNLNIKKIFFSSINSNINSYRHNMTI